MECTMMDRLDQSLQFFSQALHLRAQRQKVLASNIANNDTPHYKARDFDFASALKTALDQRSGAGTQALPMTTTQANHVTGAGAAVGNAATVRLAWRNPTQPSLDGNTVDMDVERVQFMDNALHYRVDLQLLDRQIKDLKLVMEPER